MTSTKQIASNAFFLYIRMLIVLGTSLYTVRVVLKALGFDDFGIYGLAGGMVALFAFLNATMTRAAQRFLGIEIGNGDDRSLGRTFNAILVANGAVALFVIIISLTLGAWLLNHKLKIPPNRLDAANAVLWFSTASTVAMVLRTPFSALIISHQKMWFFSATSVAEALMKLGAAFAISHTSHDRLWVYAMLMCAVSFVLFASYVWFCRVKFPESKISPHRDTVLYGTLLAFTSWSFIGNLSHVLRTHGVNMLLNVFFGTSLNATYGVMAQAQGAAIQFTGSFELALSPQIYKSCGQGDTKAMESLIFIGSKLNFILLVLLVGPAIYGMDFLLKLWLGNSLEYLSAFVSWMLLAQLLETASQPLMVAAFAAGNIKRYQLTVGGVILLNLPISWLAFASGGNALSFLYVAFGIQLATFALRIWFLRNMISFDVAAFCRRVAVPLVLIAGVGVTIVSLVFAQWGAPVDFLSLVRGSLAISVPMAVACFFLGLDQKERRTLLGMILKKARKRQD